MNTGMPTYFRHVLNKWPLTILTSLNAAAATQIDGAVVLAPGRGSEQAHPNKHTALNYLLLYFRMSVENRVSTSRAIRYRASDVLNTAARKR